MQIETFALKKMHSKMLSVQWRPFGLVLNVLTLCLSGAGATAAETPRSVSSGPGWGQPDVQ